MPLETQDRTVVWYQNLEAFAAQHYPRQWKLFDGHECQGQNTYESCDADLRYPQWHGAAEGEAALLAWLSGAEKGLSLDVLLWDLCRRDLIPAGPYLITIWW